MNPRTVHLRIRDVGLTLGLLALVAIVVTGLPARSATPENAAARVPVAVAAPPEDEAGSKPAELGVRFVSRADATVAGVRFYATENNDGPHQVNLWAKSGEKLATVTVDAGSPAGWQTAMFDEPVPVERGERYVASYFAPNGHFSRLVGAFADGQTQDVAAFTLYGGVFDREEESTFPERTWGESSYFVEPVIGSRTTPTDPPTTDPTTPPTTDPTTPPTTDPTTPPTTTPPTTTPPTTTPPTTPPPTTEPPSTDFPTPATTGWRHTGVTLSPYTGPQTITADGTVIDGKDITSCLYVKADNVTIRNSRITCAGSSPRDGGVMILQQSDAYTRGVTGLTVTDTEITRPAGNTNSADYGILLYGSNVTITRVNIHNVTSGIHFSGGSVTVQDSYIGDLVNISGEDHNDGVIANGGSSGVTLRHNTINVPIVQTTPIAIFPEGEPNSYWVVDNNLLNGGGYCIYPSYTKGEEQPNHHMTITDNVFGRTFFANCGSAGPVSGGINGGKFSDGAANVWTNNTWQDTGAVVRAE